nr:MAG TPA: Protein of unknown function (DUF2680) [Caudoviricetes sp.]
MAKYQKLAIAPDGAIVFRATGRVVQGLTTQKDNRVYRDGRLYGYIGKPTKAQQSKIDKVAQSPARKHRAKVQAEVKRIRREGVEIADLPVNKSTKEIKAWLSATTLTGEAVRFLHRYGNRGEVEVSKLTQSRLNYAAVINKAVKSGKMTAQQGDAMIKGMYDAKSNEDRLRLWKETAEFFDKVGFKYDIHSRVKDQEE